jgi:hypothetical protein
MTIRANQVTKVKKVENWDMLCLTSGDYRVYLSRRVDWTDCTNSRLTPSCELDIRPPFLVLAVMVAFT